MAFIPVSYTSSQQLFFEIIETDQLFPKIVLSGARVITCWYKLFFNTGNVTFAV